MEKTNTTAISTLLKDVMNLSSNIEYEEYIGLMCDEECSSKMAELKARNLSMSLGFAQMKNYLLMKSNFKEWFLFTINDEQRQRFIEYIDIHKIPLLCKRIHAFEIAPKLC